MPTSLIVNTQQVLQMGAHTEKLQQTIQSLPNVVAQQNKEERKVADELKRQRTQIISPLHYLNESDLQIKPRKQNLVRKKIPSEEIKRSEKPFLPEEMNRGKIRIIA